MCTLTEHPLFVKSSERIHVDQLFVIHPNDAFLVSAQETLGPSFSCHPVGSFQGGGAYVTPRLVGMHRVGVLGVCAKGRMTENTAGYIRIESWPLCESQKDWFFFMPFQPGAPCVGPSGLLPRRHSTTSDAWIDRHQTPKSEAAHRCHIQCGG